MLANRSGLHPVHFGPLPPQLAALDAAHMYAHELIVEALLELDRTAALHALMLDPPTATLRSPEETRQMLEEMWEDEREDLGTLER